MLYGEWESAFSPRERELPGAMQLHGALLTAWLHSLLIVAHLEERAPPDQHRIPSGASERWQHNGFSLYGETGGETPVIYNASFERRNGRGSRVNRSVVY